MDAERVLVADDDAAFLDVMATHLRRRGFEVTTAPDGAEALQILAARGPFAVLVTDMVMPRLGGLELLREALKLDRRLEVIVITATGTLDAAVAALREDGAYDFLLKPLETINELSLAVGRAAGHRRLQLEQEALQAKIRSDAERLQALLNHAGDAILAADAAGLIQIANPTALRLFQSHLLVGLPAQASLPPTLASVITNWQTVGGWRPVSVEANWPGDSVQMVSLTPLPDGGWVMVLRDITHLKRLDDLRWQLLTQTAAKIRKPLAQALLSLSELSALLGPAGSQASDIVFRLTRLWTHIQDWMDELMALARVESGLGLRLTVVDVAAALREISDQLNRGLLAGQNLRLEIETQPNLPPATADGEMLRGVLLALVRRAAQRSPRGSTIWLGARSSGGQLWVEVVDNGPAIPESELPHIFEKSFASASVGEDGGLSLALVKTSVDRMGGQVWVRGEPPLGCALTVCLPLAAAPEPVKHGIT